MRRAFTFLGVFGALLSTLPGWLAAEQPGAPPPFKVEALVDQALRAELAGQNGQRQRLLTAAIKADALHEPARWQAGYVHVDGNWQSVEAAGDPSRINPERAQYVKVRNKTADDAAGNLRLGDYCRAHKLPQEARAHWLRVIALEPNNKNARDRLDYKSFRGVWLTRDELAGAQARQKHLREADDRWRPRLEKLRARLGHSKESVRSAALKELRAIADPDAAIPLERYVAGASPELDMVIVEVLEKMPSQDATLVLTRRAIVSTRAAVRRAAAMQLRPRDIASFAPLLLASLSKPQEQNAVKLESDGSVSLRQVVTTERQHMVESRTNDVIQSPVPQIHYLMPPPELYQANPPEALANFNRDQQLSYYRQLPMAQFFQADVLRIQADAEGRSIALEAEQLNSRIAFALNIITQQNLSAEPDDWWKWWEDYTALVQGVKPVVATQNIERSTYTAGLLYQFHGCFAPGTLVSTVSGQRPIESIRVGDLVLAQDAKTGELAYKPVLQTTTGSPTHFVKMTVGQDDETIRCTPNHLFWANRSGWTKAEELAAGGYLHGVHGTVPIWTIAPGQRTIPHNLIVADFHSYFVGRQRVLVHDNTMWEPGQAPLVPGMAADPLPRGAK